MVAARRRDAACGHVAVRRRRDRRGKLRPNLAVAQATASCAPATVGVEHWGGRRVLTNTPDMDCATLVRVRGVRRV